MIVTPKICHVQERNKLNAEGKQNLVWCDSLLYIVCVLHVLFVRRISMSRRELFMFGSPLADRANTEHPALGTLNFHPDFPNLLMWVLNKSKTKLLTLLILSFLLTIQAKTHNYSSLLCTLEFQTKNLEESKLFSGLAAVVIFMVFV